MARFFERYRTSQLPTGFWFGKIIADECQTVRNPPTGFSRLLRMVSDQQPHPPKGTWYGRKALITNSGVVLAERMPTASTTSRATYAPTTGTAFEMSQSTIQYGRDQSRQS